MTRKRNTPTPELAGIQYMGIAGGSAECKEAIMRLIQFGDRITHARFITCEHDHGALLSIEPGDHIGIKTGFGSGYGGEGPHAFSYVIELLRAHGAEVDEVDVPHDCIERLDRSALTTEDVDAIWAAKPAWGGRLSDYVFDREYERAHSGRLWVDFPRIIPFGIVDARIQDLARRFAECPDECLMVGYRRLEDIVRGRLGSEEHGAKLFSSAFLGDKAALVWEGLGGGERTGRAQIFIGAYSAHRNPRAHREPSPDQDAQLHEFLLLNHLFFLESSATSARTPRKHD